MGPGFPCKAIWPCQEGLPCLIRARSLAVAVPCGWQRAAAVLGAAQPGWRGVREEHGDGKSRKPALRYAHHAFTRVKRPYEKEII